MCGKYGINLGMSRKEYEYFRLSSETSQANKAFFSMREKRIISKAQESWDAMQGSSSMERSRKACRRLEESEHRKDEKKLVGAKLKVIKWLNDCLQAEYGEQFKLLHIKASYYWKD